MTEGTQERPRRPQTGTARRASKDKHRRSTRSDGGVLAVVEVERTLLSVVGAAEYLGVSRWTVYRLINEGKLAAVSVGTGGGRLMVRLADIEGYLDRIYGSAS